MDQTEIRTVHRIRVPGTDIDVPCRPQQNVLDAFERRGLCRDIRIGCRNGGCGVCRVQVLEGTVRADRMGANHVTADERLAGYALACRIYPESDLLIAAAPRNPCATRARTDETIATADRRLVGTQTACLHRHGPACPGHDE
ncbi:2Fe-2S iron-sulfur cluster-binding protein [Rhodopila globiformis]|nr:2Fe-2S iron-sulfur cluster binding domain-containing protein [Rhodopila globiformis]